MKRVFIVCSHPLLVEGIKSLLCPVGGLQVVGQSSSLATAIPRLAELRPDTVILGDEGDLASAPLLLRLLREGFCGKVINLSLQENTMCVYRAQCRSIADVADLVDAIA